MKRKYHANSSGRVVLAATAYRVTFQDGQVIFDQESCIYGMHTRFALEKTQEINNTPGIWYLVEVDDSCGRIPASHIVGAYEYCCDTYGKNFERAPVVTP